MSDDITALSTPTIIRVLNSSASLLVALNTLLRLPTETIMMLLTLPDTPFDFQFSDSKDSSVHEEITKYDQEKTKKDRQDKTKEIQKCVIH